MMTQAEMSKDDEKKEEEQNVKVEDEEKEESKIERKEVPKPTLPSFVPKLPFPQRLKKQKDEE